MTEILQDKNSVKRLSDYEKQKYLLFGKRGYDICPHTLKRLWDFKSAVYDQLLDKMFESHAAQKEYYSHKRFLYSKQQKVEYKRKRNKSRKQKVKQANA